LIDMQESKMPRLTSRNPIKMLKLARTTSKRKPAIKQLNPAEIKPRITSSIRHRFQRYGQLDRSYRQSHGNQNKSYERGPALAVNPSGWKVSQLVTQLLNFIQVACHVLPCIDRFIPIPTL